MENEKIKNDLLANAVNKEGKLFISCSKAFEIADNNSIPTKEIGALCNKLKIKITGCQLGCF